MVLEVRFLIFIILGIISGYTYIFTSKHLYNYLKEKSPATLKKHNLIDLPINHRIIVNPVEYVSFLRKNMDRGVQKQSRSFIKLLLFSNKLSIDEYVKTRVRLVRIAFFIFIPSAIAMLVYLFRTYLTS